MIQDHSGFPASPSGYLPVTFQFCSFLLPVLLAFLCLRRRSAMTSVTSFRSCPLSTNRRLPEIRATQWLKEVEEFHMSQWTYYINIIYIYNYICIIYIYIHMYVYNYIYIINYTIYRTWNAWNHQSISSFMWSQFLQDFLAHHPHLVFGPFHYQLIMIFILAGLFKVWKSTRTHSQDYLPNVPRVGRCGYIPSKCSNIVPTSDSKSNGLRL